MDFKLFSKEKVIGIFVFKLEREAGLSNHEAKSIMSRKVDHVVRALDVQTKFIGMYSSHMDDTIKTTLFTQNNLRRVIALTIENEYQKILESIRIK